MSKKKKHEKSAKVAIKDQEEEVTETVMVKNEQTTSTSEEKETSTNEPSTLKNIDSELDDREIERDPIISAAILIVVSILVTGIMISASILYVAVSGGVAINGGSNGGSADPAGEEIVEDAEVEVLDDDPFIGSEDAEVVMIEFSDYECPFCQRYHLNTYPEIKSSYIDTDRIGYIWKDFPLSFHNPLATDQAVAAQCVMRLEGSEKYFEYADKIFETTDGGGNGMEESQLNDLAEEIGVDKADFDACADNDETLAKVEANIEAGAAAGISGTPGFVIGVLEDGVVKGEVVSGALPFVNFEEVIDRYLEEVE